MYGAIAELNTGRAQVRQGVKGLQAHANCSVQLLEVADHVTTREQVADCRNETKDFQTKISLMADVNCRLLTDFCAVFVDNETIVYRLHTTQ